MNFVVFHANSHADAIAHSKGTFAYIVGGRNLTVKHSSPHYQGMGRHNLKAIRAACRTIKSDPGLYASVQCEVHGVHWRIEPIRD